MFTAHAAIELYANVFQELGCLHLLKAFACENGPRFYGLPLNETRLPHSFVDLVEEEWVVPETLKFGDSVVVPVLAGQKLKLLAKTIQ